MQTPQEPTKIGTSTFQHPAIRKLQRVVHLLRLASSGYALWVLWNILNWWLDADKVTRLFGDFLGRDLTATAASQRFGALERRCSPPYFAVRLVRHCL